MSHCTPQEAANNYEDPDKQPVLTNDIYLANTQAVISTILPLILGGVSIYYLLCPRATKFIEDNLELKPCSVLESLHGVLNKTACSFAQSKLKISNDLCSIKVSPYVTIAVEGIQKYLRNRLKDHHSEINQAVFFIGFGLFGMGVLAKSVTDKAVKTVFSLLRQDQSTVDTKLSDNAQPNVPTVQKPI